jgi:hypothetical protein
VILFKPEHVAPVLDDTKTQTRRTGKRRWKVGSVHKCYTKPPYARGGAEPFCEVRILDVRHEAMRGMSEADAHAEGYTTRQHYYEAFSRIYGMATYTKHLDEPLWVVEFERVV